MFRFSLLLKWMKCFFYFRPFTLQKHLFPWTFRIHFEARILSVKGHCRLRRRPPKLETLSQRIRCGSNLQFDLIELDRSVIKTDVVLLSKGKASMFHNLCGHTVRPAHSWETATGSAALGIRYEVDIEITENPSSPSCDFNNVVSRGRFTYSAKKVRLKSQTLRLGTEDCHPCIPLWSKYNSSCCISEELNHHIAA